MTASAGRSELWRHLSEENLNVWMARLGGRQGHRGIHIRYSYGNVQGFTKDQAFGFPDWVMLVDGALLFRELKSESGVLTRHQRAWHEALRDAGQDVAVWRPSDEELIRETFGKAGRR